MTQAKRDRLVALKKTKKKLITQKEAAEELGITELRALPVAMLAYNLNCWLMLLHREEQTKMEDLRHTTLVTARLFLAAKICRSALLGPCL